jgi:aspartate 1-decarboxylase
VVILIGYAQVTTEEAKQLQPQVVFVDAGNAIVATGFDPAETSGDPDLARGDIISR